MKVFTAKQVLEMFNDMGSEIEDAASNARNDAAKEALYQVAHVFQSMDDEWLLRQAANGR